MSYQVTPACKHSLSSDDTQRSYTTSGSWAYTTMTQFKQGAGPNWSHSRELKTKIISEVKVEKMAIEVDFQMRDNCWFW